MPPGGGRRTPCTDGAERKSTVSGGNPRLDFNLQIPIILPAPRPRSSMDRTARAREPLANAPVHLHRLPEEGGGPRARTERSVSQRFPEATRDLTLISKYQSSCPHHAPVVQWIEQRGQESPWRTRQSKPHAFRRRKAEPMHRRSGAQSTVSG
jgi:hypothetical protein